MNDNCHVEPIHKTATAGELAGGVPVWLAVFGMGCPNCAIRVRNSLLSLDGVLEVSVSHVAGLASVVFNPDVATIPALIDAVALAGNDGRHEYWAVRLS